MEALWSVTDALLGLSATKAEELSTLQVCFRALVVYLVLIGYVRFAKKCFLSEATGFDAIFVIVIESIASRAISGTAPFISSLAGTFILVLVIHWVISYVTRDSSLLSYVIKGKDTILIRNGKIDREALAASHMSEDDLAEDLRQEGIETPTQVKMARLERSGKLSVIRMSIDQQAQRILERAKVGDLKIVTAESCTAGAVATALSKAPGAGDYFHGGFVTYTKQMKNTVLGVPMKLLKYKWAVCAEVAEAMAMGALKLAPADVAAAVTGVGLCFGPLRDRRKSQ